MRERTFKKKITKSKYQVYLFKSKLPNPLNFAKHTWFVLVKNNKICRWEVYGQDKKCKEKWGHVYKNLFKPTLGFKKKFLSSKYGNGYLVGKIKGDENSLAKKIINFIETQSPKYTYSNKYHYVPGPNCNTYTQWILNNFPEWKIKLPRKAIGKNFK